MRPESGIKTPFVELSADGLLSIRRNYAWDGPSRPCSDFRSVMRGSLVQDALYQLMRIGRLDLVKYRPIADRIFYHYCLEDGTYCWAAWLIFKAVHWFAGFAAEPTGQPQDPVYTMP